MTQRRTLFLGLLLGLAWAARPQDAPALPTVTVLIKGYPFTLELALTPQSREHGLMERLAVPPDGGMLFVFPDEIPRRFWMKNTRVDLDIVYLDSAGRVVSTATMRAEAPRGDLESEEQYEARLAAHPSAGPARFALEFCSGTLSLLELVPGDSLTLDLAGLTARAR